MAKIAKLLATFVTALTLLVGSPAAQQDTARHIRWYATDPTACQPATGDVYYNTVTKKLRVCIAQNVWSDQGTDELNLRAFGAKGDGTTNDSAAVQAWLTAIKDGVGIGGYVPPGEYRLNTAVSITLSTNRGITIRGTDPGRSLGTQRTAFILGAALANNDTAMMTIVSAQESKITISGLYFVGGGQVGSGLKLDAGYERTTVERCDIAGFQGRGLWMFNPIGMNLIGLRITACGTGLHIDGTTSFGEGVVYGCKFDTNTIGVRFENATLLTFAGCTFYGNTPGVEFGNGGFAIGFYQCSFESSTPAISLPDPNQISEITVENCVIDATATAGTKYGIDFAGTIVNSRIQHNIIKCTPSAGATCVGLRLGASSVRNTIGPNRFSKGVGVGTLTEYDPADAGGHLYGTYASAGVESYSSLYLAKIDTNKVTRLYAQDVTIADNGIFNLSNHFGGLAVVTVASVGVALVDFLGSSTRLVYPETPSAIFSTTAGTAGKVNIYYDGGDSRYEVENKSGGSRAIAVNFIGIP